MISFESDYIEGAHPLILKALEKSNMECLSGYGADHYCASAKEKIAAALNKKDIQIDFVTGGTQTNQLIIDATLKPFEGVIAAKTGHVSIHEAGAIEYTGHKVLQIPGHYGKIDSKELEQFVIDFYNDGNSEHMVFPGMVYISFPTEYGTLYSKKELSDIYSVCKKYKMPLFIDGARLGYGLESPECDVSFQEIAQLCDIFYIGGTKCGALCGEAVVFTHNNRPEHFTNLTKKHGALLAKGRLLGVQFDTLFTDDLYFKISKDAIDASLLMKKIFTEKGYEFFMDSSTNQQFIVLENNRMKQLSEKICFSFWEKVDENHTAVRFATSWATTLDKVRRLEELL